MTTTKGQWMGALAWVLLTVGPAAAEVGGPHGGGSDAGPEGDRRIRISIHPTGGEISLDGRLAESVWKDARPIPLPYEAFPGDNTPAPVETRCFATYDREALYLACRAADPNPAAIRAYITDRDDIAGQDRIVFTVDPFNDRRRAFRFGVSALGVQYDALFDGQASSNGEGPEDPSWDAIWSSAGRITEDGYVVEASIPFRSLRFPGGSGAQSWGFWASRFWPRRESVETRSMELDRGDACELCQANLLEGLQGISPGTNMELTPSFTGGRSDRLEGGAAGRVTPGPLLGQMGLDARWGITPNLTLNATANPDFSQVEADAAQLDVNNRFALFFPEKRPFFLEGADFFDTPIPVLFTRSVVDPSVGVKLTGKSGGSAVGVLVARDETNNLIVPGDQGSSTTTLDQAVVTTAARLRHDVGASSALGAIYVAREGRAGYFNRLGGVDAYLQLLPALTTHLQYVHTESRYPSELPELDGRPRGPFGGDAAAIRIRYQTRDWSAMANAQSRGAGFRADAGFVPQVDWRSLGVSVSRSLWPEDASWFTRFLLSGGFWRQDNQAGRLNEEGVWTSLQYQGPLQSSLWVNPNLDRQLWDGREYRLGTLWFGGSIQPRGGLSLEVSGNVGRVVDLANSRAGHQFQIGPSLGARLGRRVDLRLQASIQDLNTVDGRDVYTAGVGRLRVVYNFGRRAFLRAIVQYQSTHRDPENWVATVEPSSRDLSSQILFSYKVNPRTVLFLGYSERRAPREQVELLDPSGLSLLDRTLFFKLGWAWRP